MALTYRIIFRNFNYLHNITKPVKSSIARSHPVRFLASFSYQNFVISKPLLDVKHVSCSSILRRQCASQNESEKPTPEKKPGLIQKFKQMYRDYWYVLVPVHMATSAIWFGSFYYAVRSGVDVIGILESLGVSETIMAPLKDSSAGYIALTFALYKIATPLRYAVTVGGTTFAINKLTAIGLIRPVPSRERIKEMLQERKGTIQDKINESKQQMHEKRNHVMDEMRRYKSEMRNMKDKWRRC